MKFLFYNTEPFITVSATAGYIAASTKAFSFDGYPVEISSNVNMYASFSIHSFLKALCSLTRCLRRPFNVKVKYFHRNTVTFTGHAIERKARSQRINILLRFKLNPPRQIHCALIQARVIPSFNLYFYIFIIYQFSLFTHDIKSHLRYNVIILTIHT